jgi:hypothetical protein
MVFEVATRPAVQKTTQSEMLWSSGYNSRGLAGLTNGGQVLSATP